MSQDIGAPTVDAVLKPLAAALAGEGPALRLAAPSTLELVAAPEGIAVVVATSGSTGAPKQTMLSVDALAASSRGTAIALGGEGQWLLALPLYYVAGIQVLVRSLFAGTRPAAMVGKFSPEAFIAAAAEMTDPIRFTSLVPTQLQRLVDAPMAIPALQRFDAVLLGGAPASERLLAQAQDAGITVVTTYGSAETCGGCVYDGKPLTGVEMAFAEDRILLGGDVVASGYLGDPERSAAAFHELDGRRWYRTEDLGELDAEGKLRIIGRSDDVIITGGLKVSAAALGDRLQQLPGVREVFIADAEDPDWGRCVLAAVVLDPGGEATETQLRAAAKELLAPHEVPKKFLVLEEFPSLPQGKIDRQTLISWLRAKAGRDFKENEPR